MANTKAKKLTILEEHFLNALKEREAAKVAFEHYDFIVNKLVEKYGIGHIVHDADNARAFELVEQKWKSVKMQTVGVKELSVKRVKELEK